jgi:hypothetical protein
MRDAQLTLKLLSGSTRVPFNCDIHLAEVVTNPGDSVEYKTLCTDGSFKSAGASTYDLHIVAAQDWSTDGLARFLWDNEGELAEFQYQAHSETDPPAADTPGMAGVVQLVGPSYGGERDTYAELDVTMPCQTRPTLAIAAFPVALEAERELAEAGA